MVEPQRDHGREPDLVSIVTVVKNGAGSIEATICSVMAQTYRPIEYIVIDAMSDDGTSEIIDRFRSSITRLIREPDEGISDAFNKGVASSHGAYVALLSADDRLVPDAVEAGVQALSGHPEASFCFGACRFEGGAGGDFVIWPDHGYAKSLAHRMPAMNHATLLARREAYVIGGGYSNKWKLAMDYDLIVRWTATGLKGLALDHIIAHAGARGVSSLRYREALREVMDISVMNGGNPLNARRHFLVALIKHYVRFGLIRMGLGGLASWTRSSVNRSLRRRKEPGPV